MFFNPATDSAFKVKANGNQLVCVDENGVVFAVEDKIFLVDSQGSPFGVKARDGEISIFEPDP